MRLESSVCRSDGLQRVEDGEARWLPAHAARYEDDEAQQERVACDVRIGVPVLPEPGGKRQVLGVHDGADVDGQEREERDPRTRAPVRARASGDEARVRVLRDVLDEARQRAMGRDRGEREHERLCDIHAPHMIEAVGLVVLRVVAVRARDDRRGA